MGVSRPNPNTSYHTSIHAEIQAIKLYKSIDKNRKLNILIWRVDKLGVVHGVFSCLCCSKFIIKNNLKNKVFTFDNNGNIINAVIDKPEISKGMKLKWNIYK